MKKLSEDWRAVLLGAVALGVLLAAACIAPAALAGLKGFLASPGGWTASPADALDGRAAGVAGVAVVLLALFGAAITSAGESTWRRYPPAFLGVFGLALVAYVAEKQEHAGFYGLAYPLWAVVLGLLVANTVGVPSWLRPGLRAELYTKTGLVLLGAEVLMGNLLALGPPGIAVAWVVTPIVLVTTFWFGQRVLRMESPTLNIVISADMSVCGVSAAIATAAACRAKKEELSLAISLSMLFTVAMMLVMPPVVRAMGLPPAVGGAWIGGTVDSTGAVAAAAAMLTGDGDDTALVTATAVKMIQNILVGLVAFAVAACWVLGEKRADSEAPSRRRVRAALAEIWRRMPKFVLGFLGASVVFSLLQEASLVRGTVEGGSKTLRDWCFAMAFASIGLETNFRELAGPLRSGKPVVLYVCGQSLNLALSLGMAWLMFGVLFPPEGAKPRGAAASAERATTSSDLWEAGVNPTALFYTDHPRYWREAE